MSVTTETFYDAEQKTWSGPKRVDLYGPRATLGGEILKVLKKNPQQIMQITDFDRSEITAAQLVSDSQLIADKFLKLGLKAGDVVGIYAQNTTNLTAVIIAALLCGTPWNPIYPEFDKVAIKQIFELTTPKIICCDLENYKTLKIALEEMEIETFVYVINGKIANVESIEEILQSSKKNLDEKSYPGLDLDGDQTAVILCSSGTTGQPKGVLLSHRPLLNNAVLHDVGPTSVLLCFSALFWISGVWILLSSLLNGAKRIITNLPATPENLLHLTQKYDITHIMITTPLMTQLVQESNIDSKQHLSRVHCFCFGGSKAPVTIAENICKTFDLNADKPAPLVCYGMTELGGLLTETHVNTSKRRYDTEGKLLPNMKVRIVDRENGTFLGPNEVGLILVCIPYKWNGYYRNMEATERVYKDGWINSGDVGYFDNEGHLFVKARESDIFKCNNFQIYPNRLEDLILQLPGVAEVCIFGVPDLVANNLIACAIVRSHDAKGVELTAEFVIEHVAKHVAKIYQINGGVYFLEQLPKTASGKILRRKVYDLIKGA